MRRAVWHTGPNKWYGLVFHLSRRCISLRRAKKVQRAVVDLDKADPDNMKFCEFCLERERKRT